MVLHYRKVVMLGAMEDDEMEELESTFHKDMFSFSGERNKGFPMTLRKKKGKKGHRKRNMEVARSRQLQCLCRKR